MPSKGGSARTTSSAACGGRTETIASASATSCSTEPTSRNASARSRVASLRPSDAHSTSRPAETRALPTALPISPGCTSPTEVMAVSPSPSLAIYVCVCSHHRVRSERDRLAEQRRARGRRLRHDAAPADHPAARGVQPEHLERARSLVDDEVGRLSLLDAVLVLDAEGARAALGRAAEHLGN